MIIVVSIFCLMIMRQPRSTRTYTLMPYSTVCRTRRRVLGNVDERVVGHRRPVEQTRHLPARVADPVARDLHHGRDQFMNPDAAVIGTGHRAKFGDRKSTRLNYSH